MKSTVRDRYISISGWSSTEAHNGDLYIYIYVYVRNKSIQRSNVTGQMSVDITENTQTPGSPLSVCNNGYLSRGLSLDVQVGRSVGRSAREFMMRQVSVTSDEGTIADGART